MTACVKNHSKRVALAISASLVGALSLGAAAPAVAFAEGSIETLASAEENFSAGEVVSATDDASKPLDLDNLEFVKGAENNGIKVTQVKLGDDNIISGTFDVEYYSYTDANDNGVYDNGDALGAKEASFPTTPGRYVAKVTSTSYSGGVIYLDFGVVNKSLKGATIYNKAADKGLGYDTFTFDGTNHLFGNDEIGLALNGADLDDGGNFTAAYFYADGTRAVNTTYAGTYTVVITGQGDYAGSSIKLEMTVDPFDLSGASISLSTGAATNYTGSAVVPTLTSIDGLDNSVLRSLKLTADSGVALDKGSYGYTVKVADNAPDELKASLTGEGKATVDVVDAVVPAEDFTYDGKEFGANVPTTIDLTDEDGARFDASKVAVTGVDSKYVKIDVVNAKTGAAGTIDDVNTRGVWNVTVRIDAKATGYAKGGSSATVTVTTTGEQISTASTYFTYTGVDGSEKKGESFSAAYCGENLLDGLNVLVKDNAGKVVPASDYKVVIKKDGKEVDEITDAGKYLISIESDKYDVVDDTYCTFDVTPVSLSEYKVKPANRFADQKWIAYTGSEIVPTYQYLAYTKADGTQVWKDLPADVFTVSYTQGGKVVKLQEVGTYDASFNVDDAEGNFSTTAFTKDVEVKQGKVFSDVATDHWAAEEIYQALANQYMTGYAGTQLFGPGDTLTRAQAAVVLYNMAGGKSLDQDEYKDMVNQYKAAADAAFSDVNSDYWGATEIGWAVSTGVVKGNPDGTFAPDQEITREQFAIMLANYAKLTGDYQSVDADGVLSGVAGGDEVDDWAKQEVAWAVSKGVMGKGSDLDPKGDIERAQVAIMAVRYQPEALKDSDFIKPSKGNAGA